MVAAAKLLRHFLPLLIFASAAAAGLTRTVGPSALAEEKDSRRENSATLLSPSSSSSTSSSVFVSVSVSASSVHRGNGEWLLGRNETSLSNSQRIESTSQTEPSIVTTLNSVLNASTNEVAFPRAGYGRGARDVAKNPCDYFTIGDVKKREFYSPNWPNNYPNQTDCVKVLEADKGMLLTLSFRDRFDMEPSEKCAFDFIEVRDGQHGYANRLGTWCGKQFPPDLTSKTRFLWLRFRSDENIEYGGFKIAWDMIRRPDKGVPPEPESCVINVTGHEALFGSENITDRKKLAERDGVPLDCMWVIKVDEEWKIQLNFTEFKLQKPNECDANFVDVFDKHTDIPSRLKNFCGSIADLVSSNTNTVFVRFYVEPRATNSTFKCLVTAYRDKGANVQQCRDNEYDCEDARCILNTLKCNGNVNCRFRWDEDDQTCADNKSGSSMNKEHIIIILVVFSLIMFGMSFAFVFNCVRKLIRDHRIIQEHIRQSRENRLDEIGKKTTPCPLAATRSDSRETRGSSESPSLEVAPSKELLPPPPPSSCALMAHEYARELLARESEYTANCEAMNDIHRSNNASNATQERLQESSEEPETRDNSCQTRESLFDGVPTPRRATPVPQSQCSACGCNSASTCGRHSALIAAGIPPPPHGWSIHDQRYPGNEPPDYLCSYQRFQSPKPTPPRDKYHSPVKYSRQSTFDSGTTTVGSSKHSSGTVPSAQGTQGKFNGQGNDPRYRAEAVIELPEQERRPFSIGSTKSAPDVIATH